MGIRPAERTRVENTTLDFGKSFEEYIARLWRATYAGPIERQVPVVSPYGNGFIDLFFPHIPKIIEIKTTNWARKDYLPNPSHVDQLLWYMHFSPEIPCDESFAGELTYGFSDNEGEVLSFSVPYDPERIRVLIEWAEQVKRALDTRIPPKIPDNYHPEKFPCGWLGKNPGKCEFFDACWRAT